MSKMQKRVYRLEQRVKTLELLLGSHPRSAEDGVPDDPHVGRYPTKQIEQWQESHPQLRQAEFLEFFVRSREGLIESGEPANVATKKAWQFTIFKFHLAEPE